MFFLKKKIEKEQEDNSLDIFEVIPDKKCFWCGRGPVIRYEPEFFKDQCLNCFRVFDKCDGFYNKNKIPEANWIFYKIYKRTGKRISVLF